MFNPGDLVICVNEPDCPFVGYNVPKKGNIYTIRQTEYYKSDEYISEFWVLLKEIYNEPKFSPKRNLYVEATFGSTCFKLVNPKKIDIFKKMLKEVDA